MSNVNIKSTSLNWSSKSKLASADPGLLGALRKTVAGGEEGGGLE